MRDMLAVLRPEYGYGPAVDLPTMRYMAVTTVRLRPGQEDQYAELLKLAEGCARQGKAELSRSGFSGNSRNAEYHLDVSSGR